MAAYMALRVRYQRSSYLVDDWSRGLTWGVIGLGINLTPTVQVTLLAAPPELEVHVT